MAFFSGTTLILWLQQFSPTLDWPFTIITLLGDEVFFLLLLPLVYWCIHRRIGAQLAILFLLSASLNAIAKVTFGMPRPFTVDPAVMQLAVAGGNGFPSGHTQSAVVVWVYLAVRFQKAWLWWLAGLLIFLVPLSRLYLGVHFPLDLAGGYLFGLLLLWLFFKAKSPVATKIANGSTGTAILVWVSFTIVAALLVSDHGPYMVGTVAALMGTVGGLFIERRWIGFKIKPDRAKRCKNYLAGIMVLLLIYTGLKMSFDGREPRWLFRFIRYGMLGLWTAAGAPFFFNRILK